MKGIASLLALLLCVLLLAGCAARPQAPEAPPAAGAQTNAESAAEPEEPAIPATEPEKSASDSTVLEPTEPQPAGSGGGEDGFRPEPSPPPEIPETVPFSGDQLYAVAYLGYLEPTDLTYFTEAYLDGAPPTFYFSAGEYYLVIPRYQGMALSLLRNSMETMDSTLVYEDPSARPFVVQCNVSDIFPDVTVRLTWEGETVEFSPYVSLKDGSIVVGDRGLLLKKEAAR